jgi:VWFA-related protein
MRRGSWIGLVVALLVSLAQPVAAAKTKGVAETASVVVIEVPVTVTVDGKPVRGLKAEDFEVLDGRESEPIVGFDVVDLDSGKAGRRSSIPTAGRRHFLFLFDMTFSEPSAIARAQEAARDVLANRLHPHDLAAVATYSVQRGPRLVLGFTPDRAQLVAALETLGNSRQLARALDPLGLVFIPPSLATATAGQGIAAANKGVADAEQAEAGNQLLKTQRREQQFQVTNMTRQMADLAKLLGSVDGRKYVVLLSEGFDESLLVGEGAGSAAGPARINSVDSASDPSLGGSSNSTTGDAIASGELAGINTDTMFGSGAVQNDLARMIIEFQRAHCVIQAVNIGGLKAGGSVRAEASGKNSLVTMAKDTGGEVYLDFNNAAEAMDRILEATNVTYVLAIQPENLKRDGKYRRLRVRLKNPPRGVEISARPGYYAPAPTDQQSPVERQLRTAGDVMGTEGGSIQASLLTAPFRGSGNTAYVPLVLEIDGKSLLAGTPGDTAPVEIYAYALDEQGTVHDFFTQSLGLDLKQSRPQLLQAGLKYYGHLDLPIGAFEVRVFVRNLASGQSSLLVSPLTVPDYNQSQTFLGPPISQQTAPWVLVREEASRQREVPYPFMLGETPYLPAARALLPANGPGQIQVPAAHLDGGALSVEVRLFDQEGKPVPGLVATGVEQLATAGSAQSTLVIRLNSTSLPAGRYQLGIKVKDGGSGREVSTTGAVDVG